MHQASCQSLKRINRKNDQITPQSAIRDRQPLRTDSPRSGIPFPQPRPPDLRSGAGPHLTADPRREGRPDAESHARDRTARNPGLQLVERMSARRRPLVGQSNRLSAGDSDGCDVRSRSVTANGQHHLDRSARHLQRSQPHGQRRHPIQGPYVLDPEHQYLPRSALGPGTGDLRRRPLPDRTAGQSHRRGTAGRRSGPAEDFGLRQALCRPQRPRTFAPCLRCRRKRLRFMGHLPASIPRPDRRRQRERRDGRLQPVPRATVLRQRPADAGDSARRMGVHGLRHFGLRSDRRFLQKPQNPSGRSLGRGGCSDTYD